MAKITLHGMFARVKGKFNKSETLYFKGCPCGKEQLGVDLLNPSKANGAKNVQSQNALKTAVQAAKTALADPTERATLEAAEVMLNVVKRNVKFNKKTVGFKAAGGIRKPEEALEYAKLAQKVLGEDYINNQTFRIGASSLTEGLFSLLTF